MGCVVAHHKRGSLEAGDTRDIMSGVNTSRHSPPPTCGYSSPSVQSMTNMPMWHARLSGSYMLSGWTPKAQGNLQCSKGVVRLDDSDPEIVLPCQPFLLRVRLGRSVDVSGLQFLEIHAKVGDALFVGQCKAHVQPLESLRLVEEFTATLDLHPEQNAPDLVASGAQMHICASLSWRVMDPMLQQAGLISPASIVIVESDE